MFEQGENAGGQILPSHQDEILLNESGPEEGLKAYQYRVHIRKDGNRVFMIFVSFVVC